MTHYYTDNAQLESDPKEIRYTFDNEEFVFTTDNGVFSKDEIDYGSYLLLKCVNQRPLGNDILDLGCGYGPIGIILGRFHPTARIDCVDINSRATNLAKQNGLRNKVNINVYQTEDICTLNRQFDTVILNPPIRAGKQMIFSLYEKAYTVLKEGGNLYIVIQKKHGAKSSFDKLENLFTEVNMLDRVNGHWLIKAMK